MITCLTREYETPTPLNENFVRLVWKKINIFFLYFIFIKQSKLVLQTENFNDINCEHHHVLLTLAFSYSHCGCKGIMIHEQIKVLHALQYDMPIRLPCD